MLVGKIFVVNVSLGFGALRDTLGSTNPHEPTTTTVDASLPPLPSKQGGKDPSIIWKHFTKLVSDDPNKPKSQCNYCKNQYNCHCKTNGILGMLHHMDVYKKWPLPCDDKQKTVFPS